MSFTKKILTAITAAAMLMACTACSSTETSSGSSASDSSGSSSSSEGSSAADSSSSEQSDSEQSDSEQSSTAEDGKIFKIGIIQMMDHVALNNANSGFQDALKENGYDESKVEITYQNGQGESSNLNTIATQYVGDNMDLIFAIATPAAQAVMAQTSEIPIIGTAITDFAEAGLVNSNDNPGTNVSGTTDMNPIEDQINFMLQLYPDVKKVGFLYCSSEDNSILQVGIAKDVLDAKGIDYTEVTVSSTNDVQTATSSIVTECDAIYIPTDNVFASAISIAGEIAAQAKIPTICGESGMVDGGGFATLGINYYNIGYQAGLMAIRVLEGADISTMPIEASTDYDYCINGEVAEAIGATIPEEFQQYVVYPSNEETPAA